MPVGGHLDTSILYAHSGCRDFYPTWTLGRSQLASGKCSVSSCQVSLFKCI